VRKLLIIAVVFLATTTVAQAARSVWSSASASWYGPGLYGNHLGCGGTLYTNTIGIAHKYLKCGTKVLMCYRRCSVLRVIDRGPYVAGRTFDLTAPARYAIGAPNGVFEVKYRILR
jgi:rare lipoprotein A